MLFGFLIGWGVFWLIIWSMVAFIFGYGIRSRGDEDVAAVSTIMVVVSIVYLIACFVGHMV